MNYKFLQISTLIIGILSPAIAGAQSGYKPLVPIPGITDRVGDFGQFFSSLFGLAISIIAILAVVMIAWGGIKYMTTDAIQGKEEGKDRIRDALLGLLLALAAYLILYYINPNLLKIKFTPARLEVKTAGFEVSQNPVEQSKENAAKDAVQNARLSPDEVAALPLFEPSSFWKFFGAKTGKAIDAFDQSKLDPNIDPAVGFQTIVEFNKRCNEMQGTVLISPTNQNIRACVKPV